MFLGDFHIHSRWSDGLLEISEIVDLYGQRGFGAIAITDHLCDSKSFLGRGARLIGRTLTQENFSKYKDCLLSEKERAWSQYRMVLIPGMEFTHNSLSEEESWHILGLGIDSFICPNSEPKEICNGIKNLGGLSIAAHPVHTGKNEKQTLYLWKHKEKFTQLFDAWEVASGSTIFKEVQNSRLPQIANSDFHGPRQLASWKTVFECERNEEAILNAIRCQKIDFCTYEASTCDFLKLLKVKRKDQVLRERLFDFSLAMF